MYSKRISCLAIAIAIGIICRESIPCWLSAKGTSDNQEKWLFLLDQIRSHSERFRSGEGTITGRMYCPQTTKKTITIDHQFNIRLAFVKPLKYRWEGRIPGWIVDPAQSGVDTNGQPTSGAKFGEKTVLFAANGPDAAYWDSDQLKVWISLWPRSTAEAYLDPYLYFPSIAYLPLYGQSERRQRRRPDEIINVLKKQQNVSIDDSGPVWKARWVTSVEEQKIDVVTVMEVDTENGFTVTKYAYLLRRPNGKETVQEQLTAKWEQRNGAFVPSHYTTQIGIIADRNYTTTEADVTWSSVNAPLADSLFEYNSFQVPPGTGVLDGRTRNPVFVKMVDDPVPEPDFGSQGQREWLIGVLVVGLVLSVIYLCRRYLRHAAPT